MKLIHIDDMKRRPNKSTLNRVRESAIEKLLGKNSLTARVETCGSKWFVFFNEHNELQIYKEV